jgi:hypothetical protein
MDAAWEEQRSAALKGGKKVLSDEEAEKVLNHNGSGLRWDSPYVALHDTVPQEELVGNFKRPPTWKKLIADAPAMPEIVVLRDHRGRPLEVVDRRQAVAAVKLAAKERGESPAIKTGRGSDLGNEAQKAERARHRDRQKFAKASAFECMDALRDAIQEKGEVAGFWDHMLNLAFDFAGSDGLWLVGKWLDVAPEEKEWGVRSFEEPLRKSFKGATGNDLISMVVILLLSRHMKWTAMPGEHSPVSKHEGTTDDFEAFAKIYGLDLAACRARVKSALSEKPAKNKKSVEDAAEEFRKQADEGVKSERHAATAAALNVGGADQIRNKVIGLLEAAGPDGLKVKQLVDDTGFQAGVLSVWLMTSAKKGLVVKLAPGRYALPQ